MPYRKAGTQNWYITWSEGGRQRTRSSGTADYEEAKRLEHQLRGQDHTVPITRHTHTLADVLAEYLTDKQAERAGYAAAELLRLLGDQTPIEQLTAEVLTTYKRTRAISDSAMARELGVLRSAINHCRRQLGWDIPQVTQGLIPREPKGRVRWITPEEADDLVAAVSNRAPYLRDFIVLGLHTGLRKGELLELTWSRVDEINRVLRFEPHHHKSKTYAQVPINETAWAVLRRRKAERDKMRPRPAEVLFRKSGATLGDIKKGFAAACARAGIDDFHPHDLRHTHASWLVQAGVSIDRVKEILRHADIKTTMRYAHLAPQNLAESVGRLDCRTLPYRTAAKGPDVADSDQITAEKDR